MSRTMTISRIEVSKQGSESPLGLLKRFNKKLQTARILKTAKGLRYNSRPQSSLNKKRRALRRIELIRERTRLIKLGKITPGPGPHKK